MSDLSDTSSIASAASDSDTTSCDNAQQNITSSDVCHLVNVLDASTSPDCFVRLTFDIEFKIDAHGLHLKLEPFELMPDVPYDTSYSPTDLIDTILLLTKKMHLKQVKGEYEHLC
jgi:hypothetical protein